MVSSVQVEMYHMQLEIWLLLLLMDPHNFTQEATQEADAHINFEQPAQVIVNQFDT